MELDCMPSGCNCLGHRMPGVSHLVPCCDHPHIDAMDMTRDIYAGWFEVEKVLEQKKQEGNDGASTASRSSPPGAL